MRCDFLANLIDKVAGIPGPYPSPGAAIDGLSAISFRRLWKSPTEKYP
jgi:hypothetical protein